jgi:hypothetical protein
MRNDNEIRAPWRGPDDSCSHHRPKETGPLDYCRTEHHRHHLVWISPEPFELVALVRSMDGQSQGRTAGTGTAASDTGGPPPPMDKVVAIRRHSLGTTNDATKKREHETNKRLASQVTFESSESVVVTRIRAASSEVRGAGRSNIKNVDDVNAMRCSDFSFLPNDFAFSSLFRKRA